MMRFVNDDGVCMLKSQFDLALPFPLPLQIGVVINLEVDEAAEDVGQMPLQNSLPHILASGFWREENDLFRVFENQPLNEHQTDIRFPKTDAVAEKCAAVAVGNG